MYLIYTN